MKSISLLGIAGWLNIALDVPPYTIVGGSPSKEIRKRFDEATIQKLLKLQWWNWPEEKVKANLNNIMSGNISQLIEQKLQNNE